MFVVESEAVCADTIYALASAVGRAGVAVVRISGARAIPVVDRLVVSKTVGDFSPRTLHMVHLVHPETSADIDYAMAVVFPAPHSFTGEDVVELHCHGSRAVLDALFTALDSAGVRLAQPGEFSKRAFANGKMDLTEAEGLVDLINAETAMQMQQAQYQSRGGMRKTYTQWADTLLSILAHYEAYIDFPDEDLPPHVQQNAFDKIHAIIAHMQLHVQSGNISERIRNGIQVAVIGAPNAGKSSLVNMLAHRDVAIVSDTAGTTRDVIEVALDMGGYAVRMFDTAGIHRTTDTIESEGIKRALYCASDADILVVVADGSESQVTDAYVENMVSGIHNPHATVIGIANKSDKPTFKAPQHAVQHIFSVSLHTQQGVDGFMTHLQAVIARQFSVPSEPIITRHRHRVALVQCVHHLTQATTAPVPELIAEDIRLAVRALGNITGQVDIEQILDIVFSDFCIGK